MEDNLYNNKTFQYNECNSCNVIFISPMPSEADFELMYPTEYQKGFKKTATGRYKNILNEIKKYNKNCLKIVDYGYGDGELLLDALDLGFKCTGVEYNKDQVNLSKKWNNQIVFESLIEFWNEGNVLYDLIVVNNVFEHLTNPKEIIKNLSTKLNKNGLILIFGPIENNFTLAHLFRKFIFNFRKKILTKKSNHIPYHLTFTTYENQLKLFSTNFELLKYEVTETAWPFPKTYKECKSFKSFILFIFGKISIFTSKILSSKAGNTFIYIGKLKV